MGFLNIAYNTNLFPIIMESLCFSFLAVLLIPIFFKNHDFGYREECNSLAYHRHGHEFLAS